jgi:hypothetical protein
MGGLAGELKEEAEAGVSVLFPWLLPPLAGCTLWGLHLLNTYYMHNSLEQMSKYSEPLFSHP